MNRQLAIPLSAIAAIMLICSTGALAQRGGPPGGMGGPPAGVGGGRPDSFPGGGMSGGSHWGSMGTADNPGRATINGSTRPATLETNQHLDTALTNALAKSGVTLPSGGLQSACSGFGNLGNCIAALHVSQNLSIPGGFTALRSEMITGKLSLGAAIHKLAPAADTKLAEKTARKQARSDLAEADRGLGD